MELAAVSPASPELVQELKVWGFIADTKDGIWRVGPTLTGVFQGQFRWHEDDMYLENALEKAIQHYRSERQLV